MDDRQDLPYLVDPVPGLTYESITGKKYLCTYKCGEEFAIFRDVLSGKQSVCLEVRRFPSDLLFSLDFEDKHPGLRRRYLQRIDTAARNHDVAELDRLYRSAQTSLDLGMLENWEYLCIENACVQLLECEETKHG